VHFLLSITMRLPFDFNNSNLNEDARIKFTFNSPEHHQNIEISIDGTEVSVEVLLETFERFLGALGVCIPENVCVGFVEVNPEESENSDKKDGPISFTLDDDEEEDEE
jgi:hypothetical protein